jgi:hypothetical protein
MTYVGTSGRGMDGNIESNANVTTFCQNFFFLCLVIFSDHVFDSETSNYEVFNTIARPIIDSSVSGFNGTIFAYGQTSSGNVMFFMNVVSVAS